MPRPPITEDAAHNPEHPIHQYDPFPRTRTVGMPDPAQAVSDPASAATTTVISTKAWVLPSRKVYSGGLTFVAAYIILMVLRHFGYDIQAIANSIMGTGSVDVTGAVAGFLGFAVSYYMPPSAHDIYTKLNNRLIALALADPKVPVTIAGVARETAVVKVAAADAKAVVDDAKAAAQDNSGNFHSGPN